MINDLIFNVCLALVVGICGVIAKELIPLLKEQYAQTLKQMEATKWAWAVDIINEVVKAVEQTVLEKHGDEKKAVAHQLIWKAFKEAGISMSEQQVDALIEAAVHSLNGEKVAQ
jgi:LL-H family phage holin